MIRAKNFSASYGTRRALDDINLHIDRNEIFGIIGPAGGGKTTFLRCLNRMNDLTPGFSTSGSLTFDEVDLYHERIDIPLLRRKLGMVFATPVPLPGTIHQNLALGPKLAGRKALDERIERSLRSAYLWEEVKDRMNTSAFALSGGQQQRLCLARTLMLEPDVLLLDEPCSGLDPISTAKIEEALEGLKKELTVVLVTNNVMQASRIADRTALFLQGKLVEHGETEQIFVNPKEKVTLDYVSGRFG